MIEILDRQGNVISRSHNLRGLRRKVGKELVATVAINEIANGEGKLFVLFGNGDSCECNWGSFVVLKESLRNWRNLYGVPLLVQGNLAGDVRWNNPALFSHHRRVLVR